MKAKISNLASARPVEADKNESYEDPPVIQPPSSAQVDMERRPLLWLPDGRMLVRRIGYRTER